MCSSDLVFGLGMSDGGDCVVSCSWDMTVRVWDVASGREAGAPLEPPSASKAGGSASHVQAIGSSASSALMPESKTQSALMMRGHEKEVLDVAVTADGSRAVSGSVDGTVRIWDVKAGSQLAKCEGHGEWVTGVAVTPSGSLEIGRAHV